MPISSGAENPRAKVGQRPMRVAHRLDRHGQVPQVGGIGKRGTDYRQLPR
jgi:hypothetical protein